MKKTKIKSLNLRKTSVSLLNAHAIKGGLPTTTQSTVTSSADFPTTSDYGFSNEVSGCKHCKP